MTLCEELLLKKIIEFCGYGNLSYQSPRNRLKNELPTVQLEFNKIHFLYNYILNEFNSFQSFTPVQVLSFEFLDWAVIVKLNYFGYHQRPIGRGSIARLMGRMNTNDSIVDAVLKDDLSTEIKQVFSFPAPSEIKNGVRFQASTGKLID